MAGICVDFLEGDVDSKAFRVPEYAWEQLLAIFDDIEVGEDNGLENVCRCYRSNYRQSFEGEARAAASTAGEGSAFT